MLLAADAIILLGSGQRGFAAAQISCDALGMVRERGALRVKWAA